MEGSEERNIRESGTCQAKIRQITKRGREEENMNLIQDGGMEEACTCASKGYCDTESFGRISENRGDNIATFHYGNNEEYISETL